MINHEPNQELPNVFYIMGTARSCSTVLEILLAAGQGAFGAGELTALPKDGFISDKECSCNQPVSRCDVWGKVLGRLALGKEEIKQWVSLQQKIDWHVGFFRQLLFCIIKQDLLKYKQYNLELFIAIKKTTNCDVIIDSSKYAGRALALDQVIGRRMSVICLTRSPEGLMNSFQKPNKDEQHPKTPLNTLIYYVITLISLRIACGRLGKHVYQLRYEDLIADPIGSLEKIESWGHLDLSTAKKQIKKRRPLDVGHIVTGNRLRRNRQIVFKTDRGNYPAGRWEKFVIGIMRTWQWVLRF